MTKKKGSEKATPVDAPVEGLGKKETLMHYNAVLIEDLNAKMQLVLECVQASNVRLAALEERMMSLEGRMAALEGRMTALDGRMTVLEANVTGLEGRTSTLEQAIRGLKDDMLDMERRICSKINRIAERWEGYESRFAALEAAR